MHVKAPKLQTTDTHRRLRLETKEYVVRVEGIAYQYGLGEVVAPGVALFKAGDYNLSKEQLNKKLTAVGKVTLR